MAPLPVFFSAAFRGGSAHRHLGGAAHEVDVSRTHAQFQRLTALVRVGQGRAVLGLGPGDVLHRPVTEKLPRPGPRGAD